MPTRILPSDQHDAAVHGGGHDHAQHVERAAAGDGRRRAEAVGQPAGERREDAHQQHRQRPCRRRTARGRHAARPKPASGRCRSSGGRPGRWRGQRSRTTRRSNRSGKSWRGKCGGERRLQAVAAAFSHRITSCRHKRLCGRTKSHDAIWPSHGVGGPVPDAGGLQRARRRAGAAARSRALRVPPAARRQDRMLHAGRAGESRQAARAPRSGSRWRSSRPGVRWPPIR